MSKKIWSDLAVTASSRRPSLRSCVVERLPIPRCPGWSTCFLSELVGEVLDDLPDLGPELVETGRRAG